MLALMGSAGRYVLQMLPLGCLALVLFLLLCPLRARHLASRGLTSSREREVLLALFVFFCAGLAALTLFPADLWTLHWGSRTLGSFYPPWEETAAGLALLPDMLTPFQEIRRALRTGSSWLMFMVLGNILMFMPLGFCVPLLWRGWRWWKVLPLGCLTSCAIEFTQFFIGRSTDIDDVILNTAGALGGFVLWALCRRAFPRLTARFHCKPKEDAPWMS